MTALLLALALGDEPAPALPTPPPPLVAEVPPPAPAPVVRRQARMPYPVQDVYDASVPRRCVARVDVDTRGRPVAVEALDCPEDIRARTLRRLGRWRWTPAPEGFSVVQEVVYEPPVDGLEPEVPDTWRRRSNGACFVRVVVAPDGTPTLHTADPGCAPDLAPVAATPEPVLRRRAPEVCVVTFLSAGRGPWAVETFRCDLRVHRHALEAVRAWRWPVPSGEPTPFTLLLQLQGPAVEAP